MIDLDRHLDAVFGDAAAAWREALAERLPALTERWELELGSVVVGGWNSVVIECGPALLKLVLRPDEVVSEARALRAWGPHAAVRVLAWDGERGALLLERLVPGTRMPASAEAAAGVLGALHEAGAPAGFPTLADLYEDTEDRLSAMWRDCPDAVAADDAAQAARSLRELAAGGEPVLLHGDPVCENFLLGPEGYRAIDPRPHVGDPAYDAAFWALFGDEARDPAPKAEDVAARLGLDAGRVLRWARAMAVDRVLQVADSPAHRALVRRLRDFIRA